MNTVARHSVAIIQARMQSSRLPGKVLADVAGAPMLSRVLHRVSEARTVHRTVVATSTAKADDCIEDFCASVGVACFRGSEHDVLDRYFRAAQHFSARIIVRLTADCPLLDPQVIDKVVQTFQNGEYDYVSNIFECTYPDGLDTEVMSLDTLAWASREAKLKSEREHVTPYIITHPDRFRLGSVRHNEDLSALRWTVDQPEDLEFVRRVYRELNRPHRGEPHCGERDFGTFDVLELLRDQPELIEINQSIKRNAGYARSLIEDIVL